MYTVYHLPQLEKVGVTSRWPERIVEQGFQEEDATVLLKTSSIDEASHAEEFMQEYFNYRKDSPMTYKQKFSKHTTGTISKSWTESHFVGYNELSKGASKADLRASLEEYDFIILETKGGRFDFTSDDIPALVDAAKRSQHRDFYWNTKLLQNITDEKARDEKSIGGYNDNDGPCKHDNIIPEFAQIRSWATTRGLYEKGDPKTQYLKLQEEAGEVARAILKSDEPEIIDGLGDTLVVLINLAHLCGYKLEDCLASAYDVIKSRSGKMVNGTFVKNEN